MLKYRYQQQILHDVEEIIVNSSITLSWLQYKSINNKIDSFILYIHFKVCCNNLASV